MAIFLKKKKKINNVSKFKIALFLYERQTILRQSCYPWYIQTEFQHKGNIYNGGRGVARYSEGTVVQRFTGHFRWFECQFSINNSEKKIDLRTSQSWIQQKYTPCSIIFICLFIILICVSYHPYSISFQIVY